MIIENNLTTPGPVSGYLKIVKELIYDKCGFDLTNLKQNPESAEYGACSFEINGNTIQYRVSKITPTKTGQFVAIWRRNRDGKTEPFDISDDLDFIIVTSKNGSNFGQFVFPTSVLADKGIMTCNGKKGKRGMRVYPPWDVATSRQAVKTQNWQTKYFLMIKNNNLIDLDLTNKLLTKTHEPLTAPW